MIATKQSASSAWRRHLLAATIIVSLTISAWEGSSAPLLSVYAFSPSPGIIGVVARQSVISSPVVFSRLCAETTQESTSRNDTLPRPNDMKLREIQSELKEMNISYADCFDRESLVKRLVEARDGLISPPTSSKRDNANDQTTEPEETCCRPPTIDPIETPPVDACCRPPTIDPKETPPVDIATEPITTTDSTPEEFDRASTLAELRSLRVRELKIKLSELKVRWGTMIEKDEMVQALCQAMEERFEKSKNFSRSGELIPAMVGNVEESTLIKELGWLESDVNRGVATKAADDGASTSPSPHCPLLLDVYATWCGPCQFLAPLLVEAAVELGPTVRVVKVDSDKYPRITSILKVGAFPTLIRFDGGVISKEMERVEGALTKDQIIDFANGNLKR